jgi:type IV secretion system protein VirD4
MKLVRAFRNMLGAIRAQPGKALKLLLLSPFYATRYLVVTAVLMLVVQGACGLSVLGIFQAFHQANSPLANGLTFTAAALGLFGTLYCGDRESDTHGSARFATDKEAARLTRASQGLLLGRDLRTGKLLRYGGPAHLLTMAPTRSGKGVGTIIPNLLTADRSVICIDPKGENARIAGRARNRFGPVFVLDHFGVTGRPSAGFNPLAGLDPNGLDVAEEAATLAEALVYDAPGEAGEAQRPARLGTRRPRPSSPASSFTSWPRNRRSAARWRLCGNTSPTHQRPSWLFWSGCRPPYPPAASSRVPPTAISARIAGKPPASSRLHSGTRISSTVPA